MSSSPVSLFGHRGITPLLSTRLPLGALMQSQWHARRFLRYDLALRTLTARHLLAGGSSDHEIVGWYRKMQEARAGKDTLPAFTGLVEAIRSEGLSSHYPVGVSPRGELLDGAHRTAVALALNVWDIAVDVRRGRRLRPYGREWFRQQGFPEEALVAMDREVETLMASTGGDMIMLTAPTDDPLQEWVPAFLPADTEVVREWSVSLSDSDTAALEAALSFVPWHDKSKQQPAPRVFHEGPVTVLRLRVHSPRRIRIEKTSTAREVGALEMQRSMRAALPEHPVIVGQTIQQNRDAIALLTGHGWSPTAGEPWA